MSIRCSFQISSHNKSHLSQLQGTIKTSLQQWMVIVQVDAVREVLAVALPIPFGGNFTKFRHQIHFAFSFYSEYKAATTELSIF